MNQRVPFITSHLALICLLILLSIIGLVSSLSPYRGHSLLSVVPQTKHQLQQLNEFLISPVNGVNFWSEPAAIDRPVDIMVSYDARDSFHEILYAMDLKARVKIPDVGRLHEKESLQMQQQSAYASYRDLVKNSAQESLMSFHSTYRRYQEIEERLANLVARYPNAMTLKKIGLTAENRPIYAAYVSLGSSQLMARSNATYRHSISSHLPFYSDQLPLMELKNNTINDNRQQVNKKPMIMIDGGHHAREWISVSTSMYLLERLVLAAANESAFATPGEIDSVFTAPMRKSWESMGLKASQLDRDQLRSALEKFDFVVVPVVNPDGYEYTHTSNRMWRKNRSRSPSLLFGSCRGADLNRNYPFEWAVGGSSSYPCSAIFHGSRAGSELETQAIMKLINQHKDSMRAYVSLHAYSQVLLTPWGYTTDLPQDHQDMDKMAIAISNAIESYSGTVYNHGTAGNYMYIAAGGSDDYAKGQARVKYTLTIELPDKGQYGFMMPASFIVPVAEEMVVAIKKMSEIAS